MLFLKYILDDVKFGPFMTTIQEAFKKKFRQSWIFNGSSEEYS